MQTKTTRHLPFQTLFLGSILLLFSAISVSAQHDATGIFEHHQDIGDPKLTGTTVYDADKQTYLMSGAGVNMWARADQFQFSWKKIKGDFIVRATVQFIGKGAFNHRKIGIMAREKLTTDSRYADACVHGDELSSLQYRNSDGDTTG